MKETTDAEKVMSAKNYLQDKYPSMRGENWNITNIDDNWVAKMMTKYAKYRLDQLEKKEVPSDEEKIKSEYYSFTSSIGNMSQSDKDLLWKWMRQKLEVK